MNERTVWVGFTDGIPHTSEDPNYEGVRVLHVFRHKIDAQTCFQDVRKAKLVIEPKNQRRAPSEDAG